MPTVPLSKIFANMTSSSKKRALAVPLSHDTFSFDSVAVAGFFGGDTSVAGMATVNLIPFRRWVGWYSNPGSYEIAKKYGPLGKAWWLDGLFPDGECNPAKLFKLDGREGPQFVATHSGTIIQQTGHLGHLITRQAAGMERACPAFEGKHGRITTSPGVTIVNMQHVPELGLKETSEPSLPRSLKAAWSALPMAVSIGACVGCGLVRDWFCLASIVMGIVAHGIACYVIGSGRLTFKHPKPAQNAPPGDGVLKGKKDWVVLIGSETVVNAFTRGRFLLQYGAQHAGDKSGRSGDRDGPATRHRTQGSDDSTVSLLHHSSSPPHSNAWIPPQSAIGVCAVFLIVQFIGQLLVIPHGTLFGQIMFIATVLASWVYNTYLSSIDRDELQMQILSKELALRPNDHMRKFELNTFTATVAFACFALASANPLKEPLVLLDAMLPNNTAAWKAWKERMAAKLKRGVETKINFTAEDWNAVTLEEKADKDLLQTLFYDAEDAWDAWFKVRDLALPSKSPRARKGPSEVSL